MQGSQQRHRLVQAKKMCAPACLPFAAGRGTAQRRGLGSSHGNGYLQTSLAVSGGATVLSVAVSGYL